MKIPERLYRFPTTRSIESLAARFGLPFSNEMQDWELEVADFSRIKEFMEVYISGSLDEEESFTLMAVIIASFDESEETLEGNVDWTDTLKIIEENFELHAYTVWYWSNLEEPSTDDFKVSPYMRELFEKFGTTSRWR